MAAPGTNMMDNNLLATLMSFGGQGAFGPMQGFGQQDPFASGALEQAMLTRNDGNLPSGLSGFVLGSLGLLTEDKYGRSTLPFRTNFSLHGDYSRSSMLNSLIGQNTDVTTRAGLAGGMARSESIRSLFNEGSAIDRALSSDTTPEPVKALLSSVKMAATDPGSPLAGMAPQLINMLTGYDRGMDVNVFNANSIGIASSLVSQSGGNRYDILSDEFRSMRESLTTIGTVAVDKMMYDGEVKRASMHGASNVLVGKLMSDAMLYGGENGVFNSKAASDVFSVASLSRSRSNKLKQRANDLGHRFGKDSDNMADLYDGEIQERADTLYNDQIAPLEQREREGTLTADELSQLKALRRAHSRLQGINSLRSTRSQMDDLASASASYDEAVKAGDKEGMAKYGSMLDKMFAEDMGKDSAEILSRLREVANGGGLSMSDILNANNEAVRRRTDLEKQLSSTRKDRNDLDVQRGAAARRGADRDELESLDRQIADKDKEIADIKKRILDISGVTEKLGEAVAAGSKDFVSSMAHVVESLKDMYGGDEKAAVQALQSLTGGRPISAKDAEALRNQLDEYKITSLAANVSLEKAGQYTEQLRSGISIGSGSNIASESGLVARMGLGLAQEFMQMAAGATSEADKNRILQAGREMAPMVGNSQGARVMTLFELAKQRDLFAGNKETQGKIEELLQSSNVSDFNIAKRMILQLVGGGSEAIGRQLMDNPQAMALLINELGAEGQKNVSDYTQQKHQEELQRRRDLGRMRADEQGAAQTLYDLGVRGREMAEITAEADDAAIKDALDRLGSAEGASADDRKRIATAKGRYDEIYTAMLKKNGGDVAAARRDAVRLWEREMKRNGVLTEEQMDAVTQGRHEGRMARYARKANWAGGEDVAVNEQSAAGRLLRSIGALDEGGTISGQAFAQAVDALYDALGEGSLTDKDGNVISRSQADEERRRVGALFMSGDPGKQQQAMAAFMRRFANMSQGSRESIERTMGRNTYMTKAVQEEFNKEVGMTGAMDARKRRAEEEMASASKEWSDAHGGNAFDKDTFWKENEEYKKLREEEKAAGEGGLSEEKKKRLDELRRSITAGDTIRRQQQVLGDIDELSKTKKGELFKDTESLINAAKDIDGATQDAVVTALQFEGKGRNAQLSAVQEENAAAEKAKAEKEHENRAKGAGELAIDMAQNIDQAGKKFINFLNPAGEGLEELTEKIKDGIRKLGGDVDFSKEASTTGASGTAVPASASATTTSTVAPTKDANPGSSAFEVLDEILNSMKYAADAQRDAADAMKESASKDTAIEAAVSNF